MAETNTTETNDDMAETLRRMRAALPVPEGMVVAVRDLVAQHRDVAEVDAEALALALRYRGYPWPLTEANVDRAESVMYAAQEQLPALRVLARGALAFGPQYVVHSLHPTAIRTVLETDLAFWPSTAPRALLRPLLVRAQPGKGTGCLFGPIESILLLPEDAEGWSHLAIGIRGNGVAIDQIQIAWSKDDDEEQTAKILQSDLHRPVRTTITGSGVELSRLAVLRFLVTLGLFLEAESQAGARVATVRAESGTLPDGRPPKKGQGYTVRHIRISDEALATPPRAPGAARHEPPPHPDGLRAEEVLVRGFLRRQVCGKGRSERKVIFVAPFRRTQWVSGEKEVKVR